MTIGLNIKIKNEYGNYLAKIFASIDLSIYMWKIITDDILREENGELKQGLFETDLPNGNSFKNAISRESYYLIFADFKAYFCDVEYEPIQTFEDFMESNCQIVFMCWDSSFVEIYCKDKKILEKIYYNCKGFDCESISDISAEQARGKTLIAF